MNILYISAYDAPRGQSARTYLFAKELAKRGHDVTFVTNGFNHFTRQEYLSKGEWYRVEMIDGIRIIWLKTYRYKTNGLDRFFNMITNMVMSYLYHTKVNIKPDIVIGPSVPTLSALSALIISKRYNAKFIYEIRDPWPEMLIILKQIKEKSIFSIFLRRINSFLYKESSMIISALPNINQLILRYDIAIEKCKYISNPVEIITNTKNYSGIVNENIFNVIHVGGSGPSQDFDTMFEVSSIIDKIDSNVVFSFYGIIDSQAEIIKKKYSNKNLKIYPPIAKEKVQSILQDASLLVSARGDNDNFIFGINSNKIYDYLVAGKPIVFSANAPSNPVELSGAGFVVKPENPELMAQAILKIKNMSQKERDEMGAKGRKYAEEHLEVGKLTDKLEDLLKKLLNGE